jgi:hypothetical protein
MIPEGSLMKNYLAGAAVSLLAMAATPAMAGFINGDFEANSFGGWTQGAGSRDSVSSPLNPLAYLPSGSSYDASRVPNSAIVGTSYVDPNVGALLGGTVFGGSYSARIEDTVNGGYASVISQKVTNYTDPTIFFAWKAVLENGGHSATQSAIFQLVLRDITSGLDIITRTYDAGGGVDANFSVSNGFFYTPKWQIESLTIDSSLSGHDFELVVLAADCAPTGHTGYAYLDGFGASIPDPDPVPEPATFGLMGLGLLGLGYARRRKAA